MLSYVKKRIFQQRNYQQDSKLLGPHAQKAENQDNERSTSFFLSFIQGIKGGESRVTLTNSYKKTKKWTIEFESVEILNLSI